MPNCRRNSAENPRGDGNGSHQKSLAQSVTDNCLLCDTNSESETHCGFLKRDAKSGITVHEFCLYFGTRLLQQSGRRRNKNLCGYLSADVIREHELSQEELICEYCKRLGATIHCVEAGCNTWFHLPCGRNNGTFHEFFDRYRSFCHKHRPPLRVTATGERKRFCFSGVMNIRCIICEVPSPANEFFRSPCCVNSKCCMKCVQEQALTSGESHFACPFCKNVNDYKQAALRHGIYIPDRDAQWELGDDYADLYVRPNSCSAAVCHCPFGLGARERRQWPLLICAACGGKAIHSACIDRPGCSSSAVSDWLCDDCGAVSPKRRGVQKSRAIPEVIDLASDSDTDSGTVPSTSRNTADISDNDSVIVLEDSDRDEDEIIMLD